MKRLIREPLFHFLMLGMILFCVSRYRDAHPAGSRIVVGSAEVKRIGEQYQRQYGSAPTPKQLEALLNATITDEMYYREALRLGLGQDDEIVRRRLIQKYQFLTQDLQTPAAPSTEDLLGFYLRNPDRYRLPERVTFTHVYFSSDSRGEAGARDATAELAARLNNQGAVRAADLGDRFPGAYDFSALTRGEVERVFGRDGLAGSIFEVRPNHWSTPFKSGFGWHTVYVNAHVAARSGSFEEVRERVHEDYLDAERARRNADALAELRTHFTVVRE